MPLLYVHAQQWQVFLEHAGHARRRTRAVAQHHRLEQGQRRRLRRQLRPPPRHCRRRRSSAPAGPLEHGRAEQRQGDIVAPRGRAGARDKLGIVQKPRRACASVCGCRLCLRTYAAIAPAGRLSATKREMAILVDSPFASKSCRFSLEENL